VIEPVEIVCQYLFYLPADNSWPHRWKIFAVAIKNKSTASFLCPLPEIADHPFGFCGVAEYQTRFPKNEAAKCLL
jgi:hypothetical protein